MSRLSVIGPPRDPNTLAQGLIPAAGVATAPTPTRSNTPNRSILQLLYPGCFTIEASARQWTPAGIPSPGATETAWLGLIDWTPQDNGGQQFGLFGVSWSACSPDVAGSLGVFAAWGNSDGSGAAVIVGRDIQAPAPGTWGIRPIELASFGAAGTAALTVNSRTNRVWTGYFPDGQYLGTTLGNTMRRTTIHKHFSPQIVRIPDGSRLQAALVMTGAQVAAALLAAVPFRGSFDLQLNCAFTRDEQPYNAEF